MHPKPGLAALIHWSLSRVAPIGWDAWGKLCARPPAVPSRRFTAGARGIGDVGFDGLLGQPGYDASFALARLW
jgi:hypothetical protein